GKLLGGLLTLWRVGGLAVGIGLVIDDSVVVVKNFYRLLGEGGPADVAAESATRELLGPVLGSTLTTVVVFLPLGLLQGAVGEFFVALSITLTAAVLLSLLYALTLVPLLAEYMLARSAFRDSSSRLIEAVNRA